MTLADTGFWIALMNRRDRHHAKAKEALQKVRGPLIVTWPVMTETCHLLLRLGTDAEIAFIETIERGNVKVFELGLRHIHRVATLMKKYRDLPMDLADASLVVAAETLGSGNILSTDERDFRSYRWKSTKPFKNLLL